MLASTCTPPFEQCSPSISGVHSLFKTVMMDRQYTRHSFRSASVPGIPASYNARGFEASDSVGSALVPWDPLFPQRTGLVFMRFFDDKCNCSSCALLAKSFEDMSDRYRQATFFDANINVNSDAIDVLRIQYLPTVIAFKDRRELSRFVGTDQGKMEGFVHQMAHKI